MQGLGTTEAAHTAGRGLKTMADLELAMADFRNAKTSKQRRMAEAAILTAQGDVKAAEARANG